MSDHRFPPYIALTLRQGDRRAFNIDAISSLYPISDETTMLIVDGTPFEVRGKFEDILESVDGTTERILTGALTVEAMEDAQRFRWMLDRGNWPDVERAMLSWAHLTPGEARDLIDLKINTSRKG